MNRNGETEFEEAPTPPTENVTTDTGISFAEASPSCPECGSTRLYKDGLRYLADDLSVQRWLCRTCGYRFTEKNPNGSNRFQHASKVDRQILNSRDALSFNCQGSCEALSEAPSAVKAAKTLAAVEKPSKNGLAGAAKTSEDNSTPQDVVAKTVEFAWWMKKQGYAESTILSRTKLLSVLAKRGANLLDPESVKETIAKQQWSEGRKENAVEAYTLFLKIHGGKWEPPIYKRIRKIPFIPTETEIDQLIAGSGKKMSIFLQILKETGARSGEAWKLRWTDIDYESKTIRITPEKSSDPRIFKISQRLLDMLSTLPKNSPFVFGGYHIRGFARSFQKSRKQIAQKLGNPRLLQITFHTLRHWKATMEYAKTKDILHVMKILGHRNIKNTLIYTQLIDFKEDEYVCRTAKTIEEATQLIEAGFEYVTEMEGIKLFKKRK
jgi:integrase/rubredoxin